MRPRIIASRNLKILQLSGRMQAENKIGVVRIGFNPVSIFDRRYQRSIWQNSGEIIAEGVLSLGQGVRISNRGCLKFGDNVCITANSSIICDSKIEIGENSLVSWDVLIMDNDFHKIFKIGAEDRHEPINSPKPIIIGKNVWIGCRTLILKGSQIAENTIVAAASIITKKYTQPNVVVGSRGILKKDVFWRR